MVSVCSDFSALSYSNKRGEKSTETPYALKQGGPTTRVRPWWLEGKSLLILAASSMNKMMFIYANQIHCNVCCGEKKKTEKKIIILKKNQNAVVQKHGSGRRTIRSSSWRVLCPRCPSAGRFAAAAVPPQPGPGSAPSRPRRRHFPQLRASPSPGPALRAPGPR